MYKRSQKSIDNLPLQIYLQKHPNMGKNNEKGLPRSHIFTLYNMRFCYMNFAVDMFAGLRPASARAGLWPEFFGSKTRGGIL